MLNHIKPIVFLLILTLTFSVSADNSDLQVNHSIISIDISSTQDPSTGELDQLAKDAINEAIEAVITKQLQPALQILDKYRTTLDNEIKSNEEKIAKQNDVIKSAQNEITEIVNDIYATEEIIRTLNRNVDSAHRACKSSLGLLRSWASFICDSSPTSIHSLLTWWPSYFYPSKATTVAFDG